VKELNKEKILKQIGSRIAKARIKLGLSRYQLAFDIGTSEKHIRQIENGEINTSIFKIYQIAEALDKKVEEFIK
jgi:transcriptional regulator with XRE-family HTH domain